MRVWVNVILGEIEGEMEGEKNIVTCIDFCSVQIAVYGCHKCTNTYKQCIHNTIECESAAIIEQVVTVLTAVKKSTYFENPIKLILTLLRFFFFFCSYLLIDIY